MCTIGVSLKMVSRVAIGSDATKGIAMAKKSFFALNADAITAHAVFVIQTHLDTTMDPPPMIQKHGKQIQHRIITETIIAIERAVPYSSDTTSTSVGGATGVC
jgi:hypothetical protein